MTSTDRSDIIALVKALAPWAEGEASPILGGINAARARLLEFDAAHYGMTRNHTDGGVLRIGPYVRHGVIPLADLRDHAREKGYGAGAFLQQLGWRDYFQRIWRTHPDWIWDNVADYKTGYSADDYADDLPDDILTGETGVAAIDGFIAELVTTGYLHNHTRLYLAAYIVHWRRVKWQAGARWFLTHLLDGDPASNNMSWQWVSSTSSNKPYYFNLDNLQKFAGNTTDTSYARNKPLAGSYEDLRGRLFPLAGTEW